MAQQNSVQNITRGYAVKLRQALRGIENCACTWVVEGESIRDLTLAESIAARNEQAKLREPLAYHELPGIEFRPPRHAEKSFFESYSLVWEAHKFAREAA